MSLENERRVVMVRRVARRWIHRVANPEYRFTVLYGMKDNRFIPSLLRSQRDGKVAMEEVPAISDLGVRESFDSVTLWSKDREAMISLKNWFEQRGYETSGVW